MFQYGFTTQIPRKPVGDEWKVLSFLPSFRYCGKMSRLLNVTWVCHMSSLQMSRGQREIAVVFLWVLLGAILQLFELFSKLWHGSIFWCVFISEDYNKQIFCPIMAGSSLMFSPANHPSRWKSSPCDHSLLKIAGLSFTACAGRRVEMGRGGTNTIPRSYQFTPVYSVVQCL